MNITYDEFAKLNWKIKDPELYTINCICDGCRRPFSQRLISFLSNRIKKRHFKQLCGPCFKKNKRGQESELTADDLVKNNGKIPRFHSHCLVKINCRNCKKEQLYSSAKSFISNRKFLDNLCSECYGEKYIYQNEDWLNKNREAQLKIQSTPSQKMKNAKGVSKSWTKERKEKLSVEMKKKWKDGTYNDKNLSGFSWTGGRDLKKFEEIISKSRAGVSGIYNGIKYDSLLELQFILTCEEREIPIKRWKGNPIKYFSKEKNKYLNYFPDFVIFDKVIVEIKGEHFSGLEKSMEKKKAAEGAVRNEKSKYPKYRFFQAEGSTFLKRNRKLAKTIHENYLKKNS